jgi:hypothetical protein
MFTSTIPLPPVAERITGATTLGRMILSSVRSVAMTLPCAARRRMRCEVNHLCASSASAVTGDRTPA